jgi:hypothetical protein
MKVWAEPFSKLRIPKLFNLRADPYERTDITSNIYYDWAESHAYVIIAAQPWSPGFLRRSGILR